MNKIGGWGRGRGGGEVKRGEGGEGDDYSNVCAKFCEARCSRSVNICV